MSAQSQKLVSPSLQPASHPRSDKSLSVTCALAIAVLLSTRAAGESPVFRFAPTTTQLQREVELKKQQLAAEQEAEAANVEPQAWKLPAEPNRPYYSDDAPPGPFHKPVPTYGPDMFFTYDHASTAAEGYQRGRAALIHAYGNYALSRSQAGILDEQSRWMDHQNDMELIDSHRVVKEMRRFENDCDRVYQRARNTEGRAIIAAKATSFYREAYELPGDQVNFHQGVIHWPAMLRDPKFTLYRERLEQLFERHVAYGEPSPAVSREIGRCVRDWKRLLECERDSVSLSELLGAQRFLTGLKFEALALSSNA